LVDLNFVAATCRKCVYTLRLRAACVYFIATICHTNSNQFEFMRKIAATKFCSTDDDFHLSHEATCCSNMLRRRVARICRIVCLGHNLNQRMREHRLVSRHVKFELVYISSLSKSIACTEQCLITATCRSSSADEATCRCDVSQRLSHRVSRP